MTKVLVDMDGVLANSLPGWLDTYALFSGEYLVPEDITGYGFEAFVGNPKLFFSCLERGLVFLHAPLMHGAAAGFNWLAEDPNLNVYIVTYSHEDCSSGHAQKIAWMKKHFPEFPTNRIIFIKDKELVRGDYIIEDAPQNIERWLAANPAGRAFIIDQPYNAQYSHPNCTRVQSINEVVL